MIGFLLAFNNLASDDASFAAAGFLARIRRRNVGSVRISDALQ